MIGIHQERERRTSVFLALASFSSAESDLFLFLEVLGSLLLIWYRSISFLEVERELTWPPRRRICECTSSERITLGEDLNISCQ
jgi:hypothetical protein